MSDIPSTSKKKRKCKLPTPPPDPREPDPDDFLAYLDALQKTSYSRSNSTFAPVIATEDAFDHLEKLYKLMEQMLALREQNARLHRKVRDLEHLNNLEKMRRQLEMGLEGECPELDKDTAFAETILESILAETKGIKKKGSKRTRQSVSRRERIRSGSMTVEKPDPDPKPDRRASCTEGRKKPAKVSKWTKVKAAFKWEKASSTVGDAKSQDSGIGVIAPTEVARYLRVPSTCDDHGHSPVDSGTAEVSTPGTLSTASSTEDFHRNDVRNPCEDFRSSDDEHSHSYIPHSKEGSQKSNKSHHKTPWAKMKDIIQTRNSFKKKHRLSGHSDDIQIDVELCSDNEDNVFEDEEKKRDSGEIPPEVVARYQQALAEDGAIDARRISKWTRVKKAFLPPHEGPVDEAKQIQEEIQISYRKLQKKLSLEFHDKMSEWDRLKQHSPSTSNAPCSFTDEPTDAAFIRKMEEWQKIKSQPSVRQRPQVASGGNLPPEFRKKLQEWEKIRKTSGKEYSPKKKLSEVPRWKSLSGPKSEHSPAFEYPVLSDEFKKKLEEWKQIKAGAAASPLPKHTKKHDKEFHWFEKEKQRLEKEHQKFLEGEETLSKLRSAVVGGPKKEVLIHTPSGFHRFEGISRKFTQKLYEWEKAKGIGPESSTFALLNSCIAQQYPKKMSSDITTQTLVRSKSADSIAITAPAMSHQPSSLSLNDVEDLEKECLADSKASSVGFISNSRETLGLEEPEALIVEIEDIVEETAAPLRTFAQKTQQPVYQRQEIKTMLQGETCLAPKVRRSESTRAQNNYNLIEEIFSILKNLTENEAEIQKTQEGMGEAENKSSELIRLKMFDESQKAMASRLNDKIARLQDANSNVFASLTKEETGFDSRQVVETLETVQDLASEISQLTEKLDQELNSRNVYNSCEEAGARSLNPITELAKDIKNKMLDLRRRLSYICAASDMTAPRKRKPSLKKKVTRKSSAEATDEKQRLFVKAETRNVQSQGAIKKRIRYKQKSLQNRNTVDTDEDEDLPKNTHKKLSRTVSVPESTISKIEDFFPGNKPESEEILVDENLVQKVAVPTKILNISPSTSEDYGQVPDSPVTVFVKTTRKLFTPLIESGVGDREGPSEEKIQDNSSESSSTLTSITPVMHLPPLRASPIASRKTPKDISPSIRIMMEKYHQKLSEQESLPSSGSPSPVAWKSPTAERRVKAQTERYQEEVIRRSPVQKSASAGFLHKQLAVERQTSLPINPPVKSCSASAIVPQQKSSASLEVRDKTPERHSPEVRQKKLQKAKEEFFRSTPQTREAEEEKIRYPSRNRLSQISVESGSSCESAVAGALIKSASAGMINVDPDVYRQFQAEIHGGGYVSLPRNSKKPSVGSKFGFSSIASKFRKVAMRRGKEKQASKMNAVSALCRQSLMVDIQPLLQGDEERAEEKEEIRSAPISKSGSWIKRPKIFKK